MEWGLTALGVVVVVVIIVFAEPAIHHSSGKDGSYDYQLALFMCRTKKKKKNFFISVFQ